MPKWGNRFRLRANIIVIIINSSNNFALALKTIDKSASSAYCTQCLYPALACLLILSNNNISIHSICNRWVAHMKLLHALADKQAEYSYRLPATPTHTLPSSSSSPARPIKPIRNKPGSYCVCFSLLLPFFSYFFNGFNIIRFSYGSCYCCCSLLPYFLSSFVVITFVDQLISVILYVFRSYLNQPTFWAITLNLDIILYFDNYRF